MNSVLLGAGVVAVIAAVIGGGVKGFGLDIDVLKGWQVRTALGLVGLAFLVAAVALREDDGSPKEDASLASYQRHVVGTCRRLREIASADISTARGPSGLYDKQALLSELRTKDAAAQKQYALLLRRRVPGSLKDEADAVRRYAAEHKAFSKKVGDRLEQALPGQATQQQLNAAAAPLQGEGLELAGKLEDAMSNLADRDCKVSTA